VCTTDRPQCHGARSARLARVGTPHAVPVSRRSPPPPAPPLLGAGADGAAAPRHPRHHADKGGVGISTSAHEREELRAPSTGVGVRAREEVRMGVEQAGCTAAGKGRRCRRPGAAAAGREGEARVGSRLQRCGEGKEVQAAGCHHHGEGRRGAGRWPPPPGKRGGRFGKNAVRVWG
jgi:hypothetical protein